ncbi:hypothetical protein ACF0H5_015091 [Mactra antiquata]
MDRNRTKSYNKQSENNYLKPVKEVKGESRPNSRYGGSSNNSRRNSVLSLLPKTPPYNAGRRYSSTYSDGVYFDTSNDGGRRYDELDDEERGADVASKATSKVSRFLDYYNEALRRRLQRELMESVALAAQRANDFDPISSEEDNDDDDSEQGEQGEIRGKAAAYWKKALRKTKTVPKVVEPPPKVAKPRKVSLNRRSLSQINRRKAVKQVQDVLRRIVVRKKFRRKVRIIIFCIRCVKDHCFKFRERSELTPYMNTLNYIDYRNDQVKDLMFDRSQFSANRQMRMSDETKRILSKSGYHRNDNEIYSAQIALRNIRSFAELPARMQKMIAKVGQYESYDSKRVISREGHPAAAFYFILSGAAVAMKMDPERPIASAVGEYVKGDNFEETPLVTDCVREVTVLTKERCEFLSISASDYKEIFMQGGVKNLNDPDQELFLKSLHFLNGWPIKILENHPKECRFHYFKRGLVLTDESQKSPWLIIVKSGSVSVMKKLRKVGPFEWRNKSGIKPLTEKEQRERAHERQTWRRIVLPELRISLQKQGELEETEERVDGKPKPFQHPDIKVHLEESDAKGKKYYYPNLWTYKASGEEEKLNNNTFSNINKQYLYTLSANSQNNADKTGPGGKLKKQKTDMALGQRVTTKPDLHQRPSSETGSYNAPSFESELSQTSLRSILISPDNQVPARTPSSVFDEHIRTIAAVNCEEQLSDIDVNPQFVHIQTLIKGDVWGLADIMLDDQPSFIVVSNGADCVLLSKQFYQQHCSEKLQRQLKQDLSPYPSDETLQDNLQVSVDWNEHRRCELTDTMDVVGKNRTLRDLDVPHITSKPHSR